MSSLSAARADNYYYPKEWRPEHGSINKFHGSHPLGKRAKDIADGVLVVRFEMPFNVWCTHCDTHIGRGVRYNAKKRRVDKYFTTTIWEFLLTCANCQGEMVIRTDPENRGYKLVSGVRKKVEEFDTNEVETERVNDPEIGQKLQEDPFFRLEHENEDKRVAKQRSKGLNGLIDIQDTQFKDDYASNAALRTAFRQQKKQIKQREQAADRLGLSIPLLDANEADVMASKAVVFKNIPGKRRVASSTTRKRSSSSNSTAIVVSGATAKKKHTTVDTFQHFGDPMSSQFHRLKMAKLAQMKAEKAPDKRGRSGANVEMRASKLLRR